MPLLEGNQSDYLMDGFSQSQNLLVFAIGIVPLQGQVKVVQCISYLKYEQDTLPLDIWGALSVRRNGE